MILAASGASFTVPFIILTVALLVIVYQLTKHND